MLICGSSWHKKKKRWCHSFQRVNILTVFLNKGVYSCVIQSCYNYFELILHVSLSRPPSSSPFKLAICQQYIFIRRTGKYGPMVLEKAVLFSTKEFCLYSLTSSGTLQSSAKTNMQFTVLHVFSFLQLGAWNHLNTLSFYLSYELMKETTNMKANF